MTNLVALLHSDADEAESFSYLNHARRLREAADEIERLQWHATTAQNLVNKMCESIEIMKITPKQKDFVRAAMRAALEYAGTYPLSSHVSGGEND